MTWRGVVEGALVWVAPTALLQVGQKPGTSDCEWAVQWTDGREARGMSPNIEAAKAAAERAWKRKHAAHHTSESER